MDKRVGYALAALLCVCSEAQAITSSDDDAINRVVSVLSGDDLSVESYYRREPSARADERAPTQRIWGVRGRSAVPVSGGRAQFEYSVVMPDQQLAVTGSADDPLANQLFRLRFDNRYGPLQYGAKVFSVGEAFLRMPIARERVFAAGLPGAGQGTEFWMSGNVPILQLRPTLTRFDHSFGDVTTSRNALRVQRGHRVGKGQWLRYAVESVAGDLAFADGRSNSNQTSSARVEWQAPQWQAYLRAANIDQRSATGSRLTSVWEFGTALRAPGLNIDALDLRLHHQQSLSQAGDATRAAGANLTLRSPLPLLERCPPGFTMTTSLGYRWTGGPMHVPDEGMSIRVSVNLQAPH